MLHLNYSTSYYWYTGSADMRKGFDSLCGVVLNELGRQVTKGDGFIFINKPRTHLKLLLFEDGGFTIFYRRLEKGTFEVPAFDLDAKSLQLTSDQLNFILKGISITRIKYRPRYQQKAPLC